MTTTNGQRTIDLEQQQERACVLAFLSLALGPQRGLTMDDLADRVPASPSHVVGAVRALEGAGHARTFEQSGRVLLTTTGLVYWWARVAEHAAHERDRCAVHAVREGQSYADVSRLVGLGSRAAAHRRYAEQVDLEGGVL